MMPGRAQEGMGAVSAAVTAMISDSVRDRVLTKAMAIVGSFDEGIRGDATVLYTKSILDGFASVALASTFGSGVLFSFIPVLLYQGGLTIFAGMFQQHFTPVVISQLTATGGLLILGIGLTLLDIKRVNLSNLLPSLVLAVALALLFG